MDCCELEAREGGFVKAAMNCPCLKQEHPKEKNQRSDRYGKRDGREKSRLRTRIRKKPKAARQGKAC